MTCHDWTDDGMLALLGGLYTVPTLQLQPAFNGSGITDYYTVVPHSVVLVRIVVMTAHCRTEARLNSVNGPLRSASLFTKIIIIVGLILK